MIYFYVVINIILLFFSLVAIPYKKRKQIEIDKNNRILGIAIGMAMLIIDLLPEKLIKKRSKSEAHLSRLSVKNNIKKEKYKYLVEKLSYAIIVFWITMVVGLGLSINEKSNEGKVESVNREDEIQFYELTAVDDKGKQTDISLEINKKKMTDKEIDEYLESLKEKLQKEMLGENLNIKSINSPMNLVSEIERAKVIWNISDSEILQYDGSLGTNISEKGEKVNLCATVTYEKETREYSWELTIFPQQGNKQLQNAVQQYIDENNQFDNQVRLPEKIEGKKISFYKPNVPIYKWLWLIGLAVAIMIFVLKDNDLKKDIEKRNSQMKKDYSEIVSKLLIYYDAGISVKNSFRKIIDEYEKRKLVEKNFRRYAYEEIKLMLLKIENGAYEQEAIREFGNRCGVHCYMRMANILEQNLRRGTKEMSYALREEMQHSMMERKNNVSKRGEEMTTKLLGPLVIMLIISIAIIVVPAFMSVDI